MPDTIIITCDGREEVEILLARLGWMITSEPNANPSLPQSYQTDYRGPAAQEQDEEDDMLTLVATCSDTPRLKYDVKVYRNQGIGTSDCHTYS